MANLAYRTGIKVDGPTSVKTDDAKTSDPDGVQESSRLKNDSTRSKNLIYFATFPDRPFEKDRSLSKLASKIQGNIF